MAIATTCQILRKSVNPLVRYRDFCDFQDGGRRYLGFSRSVRGQFASPSLTSVERLRKYGNLTVFKMKIKIF